ncbi:MAG TPA: helical backbone metal receptor [Flavobacterium sp.]|nr:helical backbone metal receptor [Flavobacterium sp.]
MNRFTDAIGHTLTLNTTPKRIVSLVPSQTELLVDLGLEHALVGITKFCVHPIDLRANKSMVGGTKKVNFDKIRQLKPDLIIANKEENTKDMVEALQQLYPVWTTDILTVEDNLKMIADFGKLLDCEDKATALQNKIAQRLTQFKASTAHHLTKRVVYLIWKNPYMAAGADNFIAELLQLNQLENSCGATPRYPEVDLERLCAQGAVDYIFLSSEPYPFKAEDAAEIKAFAGKAKVVLVDGEMFSWYGSRLLKSFDYFEELHAQLD